MVMTSGVGGSTTAPIPPCRILPVNDSLTPIWGEGDKQEGGRQAAREDGKGGGARISMPGCSYCNNSGLPTIRVALHT